MAADNRPYKSKEQDGQGNEIIIRDQQLVEQGTVTTMASGACFETFDVDNRPVKIPRDNMMSIVLECIGIIVNDSSKNLGTNVQKAIGLQGNLIGNVTVSDLASVLGVKRVAVTSTSDDIGALCTALTINVIQLAVANHPFFSSPSGVGDFCLGFVWDANMKYFFHLRQNGEIYYKSTSIANWVRLDNLG